LVLGYPKHDLATPYGLQNIPDVRILTQKERKFIKSTIFLKLFNMHVWKSNCSIGWLEWVNSSYVGTRISQKWSTSLHGCHNIAEIRNLSLKGGQIYKINNITEVILYPGLKITQEYSIDGLEYINKTYNGGTKIFQKWSSSPYGRHNITKVRILSQKGVKFTKTNNITEFF